MAQPPALYYENRPLKKTLHNATNDFATERTSSDAQSQHNMSRARRNILQNGGKCIFVIFMILMSQTFWSDVSGSFLLYHHKKSLRLVLSKRNNCL